MAVVAVRPPGTRFTALIEEHYSGHCYLPKKVEEEPGAEPSEADAGRS